MSDDDFEINQSLDVNEAKLKRKAEKQASQQSTKKKKKKPKKKNNQDSSVNQDDPNQHPKGRNYTVSVALPGSILGNAQSPELRTYLAGQIARALVIFNVDEVVIFNESTKKKITDDVFKGVTKASDENIVFCRILQYLECPQYLRKYFFPFHPDLKYAGLLNPLDSPHHMRMDDSEKYREGVVLDRPVKDGKGSFVNCGMRKEVMIDKQLKSNIRVTVQVDPIPEDKTMESVRYCVGKAVSPDTPRLADGLYWGYQVRLANSFGEVFTKSSYKGGYDLTLGTSERGELAHEIQLPSFKHVLIVFGGVQGLEFSLDSDEMMVEEDVSLLFDSYINTCPQQGSRTIRTEEAVLITLSALASKLQANSSNNKL